MDAFDLQTALPSNGLPRVFFFNGRLLTAGDLRTEQDGRRHADLWLGQGCGDGVAYGLEVEEASVPGSANPVLTIKAGLAINRAGQALKLECDVPIALSSQPQAVGQVGDGCFGACAPASASNIYNASSGLYLLCIAPAELREGKVQTSGLTSQGGACNTDVVIDTVQIRRISLDNELGDLPRGDEQKLRSSIAWRCFGGEQEQAFAANPFGLPPVTLGLVDGLRASKAITDCDVPLAIVYWSAAGLRFIDLWSVRRPLTDRRNHSGPLGLWAGEATRSLGEMAWQQFQSQLAQIAPTQQKSFVAKTSLQYLPAVGLVPIAETGSETGFSASQFFAGLDVGVPLHLDAAWLPTLLQLSLQHAPLALATAQPPRLYQIHENVVARQQGQNWQSLLVFASCSLPPLDNARFGFAHYGPDHFAANFF